MNKNIHYFLAALAGAYAVFALFFSLPYSFVPAGDMAAYEFIRAASLSEVLRSGSPVHSLYLLFCLKLWHAFSSYGPSALGFAAVLANAAALFLCGAGAYLLTNSRFCALTAALLYAFSAWTFHTLFNYSFAPLSGALMLSALYLLSAGFAAVPPAHWRAVLAGFAGGLLFWAAPSGPLSFAALLVFLLVLCRPHNRENLLFWGRFLLGALPVIIAFTPCSSHTLSEILRTNMYAGHYAAALDKFGTVPSAHMLFLRTLWAFSAPLGLALSAAFALRVFSLVSDEPRRLCTFWEDRPVLNALLACLLFFAAALEFLPFSATAKVQFPLYGVALLFLASFFFYLRETLAQSWLSFYDRLKWPVLAVLGFGGLFGAMDSRLAHRFAPEYLAALSSKAQIVVLSEDPHASVLLAWLSGLDIKTLPSSELPKAAADAGTDGLYLLLGPAGPGSGASAAGSCVLEDFLPDFGKAQLLLARAPVMLLPYSAAFAPDLLESPVCQALYLKKLLPPSAPAARALTLYHLLNMPEKKHKPSKELKHAR